MRSHLRYLSYVLRHKWHVARAGWALGVPLWRLLFHDLSKFSRAEWGPYVRRFYAGQGSAWEKDADPVEFHQAWKHHWTRNPHHWEYWTRNHPETAARISMTSEPDAACLPMPETFVREMVADWIGAGCAQGKVDTAAWYDQHGDRMIMDASTRALVDRVLGEAKWIRLIP